MSPAALLGALIIGISLGLTGAGGSILSVPVLIYLAGLPPREAIAVSLLVVGCASLAGAVQRARAGDLHAPAVAWFSLSGIAGSVMGARLTHGVPAHWLMTAFSLLMIVVAVRILVRGHETSEPEADCKPVRCFVAGGVVGILTGFLGVGGGFLLMPALQRFARLPVRSATGSSLAIITINSGAGFMSHIQQTSVPWGIAGVFAGLALAGVLAAGWLSPRLTPRSLARGLGVLTLLVGLGVLAEVWLVRRGLAVP